MNTQQPERIIIYGGGGHSKGIIELIRLTSSHTIVGIIDDGLSTNDSVLGVPVLGGAAALPELFTDGVRLAVNAVGGISNVQSRISVFEQLKEAGFTCPAIIHPTAFIERSATIAEGAQIFPKAYIGPETQVRYGTLINAGAIISHDCQLAEYTIFSPGAMLAGGVQIGRGTLVGMGATINLNLNVGSGCVIGNNATIKKDVPDNTRVRAGSVWPQ